MRFKFQLVTLLLVSGLLACRENQPDYTLSRAEVGDRVVVAEEFSGVRCPNCPDGTKELENLKVLYNDKLIIITIHAGDFAFRYPESKYDFTTSMGNTLLQLLGNPIGYPSAVINRVRDTGTQSYQVFSSRWGNLIGSELVREPVLSVSLDIVFEASERNLTATMGAVPNQDIEGALRFTLLIKENNMVDWQSDVMAPQGVDSLYNHRNVLRTILSDAKGDFVSDGVQAFDKIEKVYSFTIPEGDDWWKVQDLWLVAFVTDDSGEILQAIEKPLLP
jgi:hypothetical protein